MASAIDPTQPPEGVASTAEVRANFLAAKTEIEALQVAEAASLALNEATKTVMVYVRNATGVTLNKGKAVYISGATGQLAHIALAKADAENTSYQTLGLLFQTLAPNASGYVVVSGYLTGLDTHLLTEGNSLWLSPTTAGAYDHNRPPAPGHVVYIGNVTYTHASQGTIFVKAQNGYEVEELHNVTRDAPVNGDTLIYNAALLYYEHFALAAALLAKCNLSGFTSTGAVRSSSPTAGVGYADGAGATVTQQTSKSTAVTINTLAGQITTSNAALLGASRVSFTVNNSTVEAHDVPRVVIASGATANAYSITVDAVAAGSFRVQIGNQGLASLSEALTLNFAIMKGAQA